MNTEWQELFHETVRSDFDFLLAGGNFEGPHLKLDSKTGVFTITFMATNLAVEFVLDERDEDISCAIARMIDGQPSSEYAVDPDGRLVRASVSQVLRARGVRDRLFTKVTGLSLKDRIPITLRDFKCALLTYGRMVLEDDPAFLDV